MKQLLKLFLNRGNTFHLTHSFFSVHHQRKESRARQMHNSAAGYFFWITAQILHFHIKKHSLSLTPQSSFKEVRPSCQSCRIEQMGSLSTLMASPHITLSSLSEKSPPLKRSHPLFGPIWILLLNVTSLPVIHLVYFRHQ